MVETRNAVPPDELLTLADAANDVRKVLHWYDLICPFCYVGQQRNSIFEESGLQVVHLPFQAHPDIPAAGRAVGTRRGPMYKRLEAEARAAGLPLLWPDRLPNTRMALAAAEWTRRHAIQSFPTFEKALFAAHFAFGEDLGDPRVIDRHATEAGVDVEAMHASLESGAAYDLVDQSEWLGRSLGVHGTPAWLVSGRLVQGLYPREHFQQLAREVAL
jgi:predicted DsbA family dithiol-disulfide isomerase